MKRHIARPEYRAPNGIDWMCHCGRLVIRKPVYRHFRSIGSRAAHGAIVDTARYERASADMTGRVLA